MEGKCISKIQDWEEVTSWESLDQGRIFLRPELADEEAGDERCRADDPDRIGILLMSDLWCRNSATNESIKVSDGDFWKSILQSSSIRGAPDEFVGVIGPNEKRLFE
jgi:hypothetical protein